MLQRLLSTLFTAALVASPAAADHVQTMIRRGKVPVRGVNLGSWLVSEHWMSRHSPAWANVKNTTARQGEYATMQALGKDQGATQFQQHRESWITLGDVQEIASYGLNTVRVPVGFWIVNEDADPTIVKSDASQVYAPGGLHYLDNLIKIWAKELNVSVMLSLHAHEGSQNGDDHSAPQLFGEQLWADSVTNFNSSLQFARVLANRYKDDEAFLGLNLMNEPDYAGDAVRTATVKRYYEAAYSAIRETGNDCIVAVSPNRNEQGPSDEVWSDFMTNATLYHNVWHELRTDYVRGYEGVSEDELITVAESYANSTLKREVWTGNPVLIGEWSLAAAAPFKAGGTNTTDADKAMTDKDKVNKFAQAQLNSYEYAGAGWTFWSWRHDDEAAGTSGWSMRQLLRNCDLVLPWQSECQRGL